MTLHVRRRLYIARFRLAVAILEAASAHADSKRRGLAQLARLTAVVVAILTSIGLRA